jgi:uncharacterized RDD family membrane protein YckC
VTRDPAPRPYAGVATRAVALVLDVVLIDLVTIVGLAIGTLVLSVLIPGDHSLNFGAALTAGITWLVCVGGYFVGFWALLGRTPGMRLMRLEVVAEDGSDVGWLRASRRFVGLILAAIPFGLGFLLALVDDRRQGLQDKIGGTVVLYVVARTRAALVDVASPEKLADGPDGGPLADETVEGRFVPPGPRPA